MKLGLSCFIFSVFWMMSLTAAQQEITDNATGITFPEVVSFNSNGKDLSLKATGVATRKKLIVKVYSIASYLQEGTPLQGNDKANALLNAGGAKQLTLKWARDVPLSKVQEAYHEGLKKNIPQNLQKELAPQVENYIALFNRDVRQGDEHVLRWFPEGYVDIFINGNQVGKIGNPQFARALWSIWLGTQSVVKRESLVQML